MRNYDDFRKFEMTLLAEYVEETMYGTQILIAHKNARFLRAYFDTYRKDYKPDQSSYNQSISSSCTCLSQLNFF